VHPLLARQGWEYRACHVWDKGIAHVAGNANTKTLRKFPVVTEVCVQYVREVLLEAAGVKMPLKSWLRHEWERSGLPLSQTNEACGVKNAATRKYFTRCHLWYYPPAPAFERIAAFANERGRPEGRPYLSVDGRRPLSGEEWATLRAKFHCEVGVTNVWHEPAVRGTERFKADARAARQPEAPQAARRQARLGARRHVEEQGGVERARSGRSAWAGSVGGAEVTAAPVERGERSPREVFGR